MRKLETTVDLLDALQERYGWTSDNQVAAGIGVPQTTVSSWRRGANYPTEVHAPVLAQWLEIPAALVLVIAAADRTTDKKTREFWRAIVRQVAQGGFGVLAALAVSTGTYAPRSQAQGTESVYSGKSRRRRPADPLAA